MSFSYTDNQLSQSFYVNLDIYNSGGQLYVNSNDSDYYDNFNITVDQLEGEINVPYQYTEVVHAWTHADYTTAMNEYNSRSPSFTDPPGWTNYSNGYPSILTVHPYESGVYVHIPDATARTDVGASGGGQVQVIRKITVPNSILGGFGQWRINYTFIQYPDVTDNQGTFIAGNINTERITVPRIVYDPDVPVVDTSFTFDKNTIREAFADRIYKSFFSSSA